MAITNGNGTTDSSEAYESMAIIGCGMRLPGGVCTADDLWNLLDGRRDGRCRVPQDRYNVEAFVGPGRPGHVASEYGHFLDYVNLTEVDTSFWTMSRQEIEQIDPQQRLALEVVYECFQSSGTTKWRGKNIGAYFGIFGEDWAELQSKETQQEGIYRLPGAGDYTVPNRISYEFDLKGPSMAIRTACSSSLTAIHEACAGIQRGDCESAIVGGTNLILNPQTTIAMAEQGVMAPDGRSKTFDAAADGYGRGEAVVAIHIKKLSDALRNNDPIRAVIRASSVNNDGKTAGLALPNPLCHAANILRSHELAGLDVSQTAMVECHGTGTAVGDPIETTGVAHVFSQHGVLIGSVKPNLGHSEGASGLTSTLKVMLELERRRILPNINFHNGNPKIPFKESKLTVPTETVPFPAGKAERIGVNSFGLGGANAHVILESAASMGVAGPSTPTTITDPYYLLTFSASNPDSLRQTVQQHEEYLHQNPDRLADLSYTLNLRREPLQHRSFSVVSASAIGEPLLAASFERTTGVPNIAFVFTGQGAQWAAMGADLLKSNDIFRESIVRMDQALYQCPDPPAWTLYNELQKVGPESQIMSAEFSQPCCTAVQIALVDLLTSWGVRPSSVVGHSSGEIAAAYASGSLEQDTAIQIAYYRGLITKDVKECGLMAAIGLGRTIVEPLLKPGVVIGCVNSPHSVTISGDAEVVAEVMLDIQKAYPNALVRGIHVNQAYHSHHMQTVQDKYLAKIEALPAKKPTIPFFSSVTGKKLQQEPGAAYWVANLTSPVLFSEATSLLVEAMPPTVTILEVGPHSALSGPIRQILQEKDAKKIAYTSTLIRGEAGHKALLTTAGRLFQLGVELDWGRIILPGQTLVNLPRYAWRRDGPFWREGRMSKLWRFRKFPKHDILGERVPAASGFGPTWRNLLKPDNVPWVQDHIVAGDVVFPAAGYIAMAGEAVRQLVNKDDFSFSIRNMTIGNALALKQGIFAEIITHLRPVRLTDSLDSLWYEFEISALHGDNWVRHATGQVRNGAEYTIATPAIPARLRTVDVPSWYKVLSRFGLQYGPRFQGLRDIAADVLESKAIATITDPSQVELKELRESTDYALHPSTIDGALQLYTVAMSRGQVRRFTQLAVPTYIGAAYVQSAGVNDIRLEATAEVTPRGVAVANFVGTSGGNTVLRLQDVRVTPLSDAADSRGPDPHAAAELVWKPDIRLLDSSSLIHTAVDLREGGNLMLVERLFLACAVEGSLMLASRNDINPPAHDFLNKFRAAIDSIRNQAAEGSFPNVPDCKEIAILSSTDRVALIDDLLKQGLATNVWALVTAVHRIYSGLEALFKGEADGLELLLPGDIWTRIYDLLSNVDSNDFFKLASHLKPNMRILEIGGGTGGTTKMVLAALTSPESYCSRHYGSYTFTDISGGFFHRAKERFSAYDAMEYKVLDISQDPLKQGFEAESYDLIIAANVIHATPSIATSLSHVRKLLAPTGHFFLQEISPVTQFVNFIMGALPGWWLGEAEGRINEPWLKPEHWKPFLRAAGFGTVDIHHDEQLNATMVIRPALPEPAGRVTLISRSGANEIQMQDAILALEKKGYAVDLRTWGEDVIPGQDVICLMDLENPYLKDMQEDRLSQLQAFIRGLNGSGVLWVTGLSQVKCPDPIYGLMIGLARTIRTELLIDFATLELETFDVAGWDALAAVLPEFQRRSITDGEVRPTMEWAFADGFTQISRYHWVSLDKELAVPEVGATARKLEIEKRGLLSSLYWKGYTPAKPTGTLVRVQSVAVGLNFKDVLISMGVVDNPIAEGNGLGCEVGGIVEEVGPDVKDLRPGDRCLIFTTGALATHLTIDEDVCVKIPDSLSFEEAATMPVVYCTVIYSLIHKARLESGQSVLIHSAAGGVGIAAIQVCRSLGVEVYCTVGSEEKVDHLMKIYNIPRDRIFNSRDLSFRRDVLQATGNRGVDVVLNSLSGELLHASWECVADFGCMVEIGLRDLIGNGSLSMSQFKQNRSYMAVDLAAINNGQRFIIGRLMREMMDLYRKGAISPITPIIHFDALKVEDSMRAMQQGSHIGKVVIKMPTDQSELTTRALRQQFHCEANASYLLVGGLGGLGQAVAVWMAESGATEIVFMSRSAGDHDRYATFIEELRILGCSAILIAGDVTKLADVERAIKGATKPIRGVMQATIVALNENFLNMNIEQWQGALLPKVQGTWNLHSALLNHSLDFFLLFSSWSGIVGFHGQSNYSAANLFLDSFVQYRQAQGLVASAVDISVIEDVGYVNRNLQILDRLRVAAHHILTEADVLESLQAAINRSAPDTLQVPQQNLKYAGQYSFVSKGQFGIGLKSHQPLSASSNHIMWKTDPRMGLYRNLESKDTIGAVAGNQALQQFLTDITQDISLLDGEEAHRLLATEIGTTIFSFLMRDIDLLDLDESLEALGMDSLISIELRNWFRQRLGFEITTFEILRAESLLALGQFSSEKLKAKLNNNNA